MEETAGETPEATEERKQEEYSNLEKSYAKEDWIHRSPRREAADTKEVGKPLKEIVECEEKLKRRNLDGWRARGWEESEEWQR